MQNLRPINSKAYAESYLLAREEYFQREIQKLKQKIRAERNAREKEVAELVTQNQELKRDLQTSQYWSDHYRAEALRVKAEYSKQALELERVSKQARSLSVDLLCQAHEMKSCLKAPLNLTPRSSNNSPSRRR